MVAAKTIRANTQAMSAATACPKKPCDELVDEAAGEVAATSCLGRALRWVHAGRLESAFGTLVTLPHEFIIITIRPRLSLPAHVLSV